MGPATFWERWKPAGREVVKEQVGPAGAWIAELKEGLVAIAIAKISQQFGREEEKE